MEHHEGEALVLQSSDLVDGLVLCTACGSALATPDPSVDWWESGIVAAVLGGRGVC